MRRFSVFFGARDFLQRRKSSKEPQNNPNADLSGWGSASLDDVDSLKWIFMLAAG